MDAVTVPFLFIDTSFTIVAVGSVSADVHSLISLSLVEHSIVGPTVPSSPVMDVQLPLVFSASEQLILALMGYLEVFLLSLVILKMEVSAQFLLELETD